MPGSSSNLWGITPGPDGNLWFADASTKSVGRITTQGQVTEFPVTGSSHFPSAGITQGHDRNIWWADQNGAVGRTNTQGQSTNFPVGSGSLPNDWIWGVAPGSDGNVWFSNRGCQDPGGTCAMGKITPGGSVTEYATFPLSGAEPSDVALGPDGNVWFTDYGADAIGKVTPAGAINEYPIGHPADPSGIALGRDGNLWFTEFTAKAIGRITPDGHITEFTAGIPSTANLGSIAAGPDGNLWFVDYRHNNPAIGRVTPQGQISEFSAGLPPNSVPAWIAPGADGSMWVTNNIEPPSGPGSTAIERIGTGFPPVPSVTGLRLTPKKASIGGRRVKGRCVKPTRQNRRHKRCRRAIKLTIGYTLNVNSIVSLTLTKRQPGRQAKKRCMKRTRKNRKHKRCTRTVKIPGQITLTGKAGTNAATFRTNVGGHRLSTGVYRLTLTPAGGRPQTVQFRLTG